MEASFDPDGRPDARHGRTRCKSQIPPYPDGTQAVIILLTANTLEGNGPLVLNSGLNDFLSKPCAEDDLLTAMQTHPGLQYLYTEGERPLCSGPGAEADQPLKPVDLRELPEELIARLQDAVRQGNKDSLDQLILKVAEQDARAARFLNELADNYDYDALTHLLDEQSSTFLLPSSLRA
jgi:CheY-like chemotaxis protein